MVFHDRLECAVLFFLVAEDQIRSSSSSSSCVCVCVCVSLSPLIAGAQSSQQAPSSIDLTAFSRLTVNGVERTSQTVLIAAAHILLSYQETAETSSSRGPWEIEQPPSHPTPRLFSNPRGLNPTVSSSSLPGRRRKETRASSSSF